MKPSLKLDTREFTKAMREYGRATKKDEAAILNRAGRNVALRASQFTPKAVGSRIRAELMNNKLAIRILAARRKFKGIAMAERSAVARKFIAARVRSARYIGSAGWSKARQAFGLNGEKVNSRSMAAKGYGKKASPQKLVAILANDARGADKVGIGPLIKAVDFVARDMTAYANRKLEKTARRYSPK